DQLPTTVGITGETTVCEGATLEYHTSTVLYGETYNWTVPDNSSIISGQGDTLIQVMFGNTSGDITVTVSNSCGSGNTTSISVTVQPLPVAPAEIFGDTVFCAGDTVAFSILSVAGADSYTWTVPGSNTILSEQGDTAITILTAT